MGVPWTDIPLSYHLWNRVYKKGFRYFENRFLTQDWRKRRQVTVEFKPGRHVSAGIVPELSGNLMKYPCVIIASDIFCSSKYFPKHARGVFAAVRLKKSSIRYFSIRMFVPEHKHPLMSTRNSLHDFSLTMPEHLRAPACCGMVTDTHTPKDAD